MSTEQNIQTAEAHLQAEARRDLAGLLATLVEDCSYEDSLLPTPIRGHAAVANYFKDLWSAFPDFSYEVTHRVADASTVIYEMTLRGTHLGAFRGLPATGRSGELKAVVVFPMQDGKALGERIYLDSTSFMTQLGLLPENGSRVGHIFFGILSLRVCPTGVVIGKGHVDGLCLLAAHRERLMMGASEPLPGTHLGEHSLHVLDRAAYPLQFAVREAFPGKSSAHLVVGKGGAVIAFGGLVKHDPKVFDRCSL